MNRAAVRLTTISAMTGAAMIAALALWPVRFAAPESDEPLIVRDRPIVPAIVSPARHAVKSGQKTRTEECDGAARGIAYPPEPVGSPHAWFSSEDYPWWALMRDKQGTTTVELAVDPKGLVMACGLAGSSGHMSLDSRTCEVFRQRARFRPARDDRGCAVPSTWRKRVRWQIPI